MTSTPLIRRIAAEQGGFALIEAMVAAVLLAAIALGTLAGIDGGSAVSALNRSRSVAAGLAEADQERMRSLTPDQLSNLRGQTTKQVGQISYTIASRADWVSDSSGTLSCTNDSSRADYLTITSTVTWPGMGALKPVVQRSLYAAPPGSLGASSGSAAIQVTDRAGAPLSGVGATMVGSQAFTDATGDNGCAVFGNVPAGSYQLTLTAAGYVDPSGSSPLTQSIAVVADQTRLFSFTMDVPAQVDVSFDTRVGATWVPARTDAVAVTSAGLPAPGSRRFVSAGGAEVTTVSATSLFPFTAGYAVYAGSCASADPRLAPTNLPNYFSTNPGQVTTAPGSTQALTIHLPAVNLLVKNFSGQTLTNAHVTVTPSDSACTSRYPAQLTNAAGALPAPGYPFGTYAICADDGARHRRTATIQNTNPLGTATTTVSLPSGTSSNCP